MKTVSRFLFAVMAFLVLAVWVKIETLHRERAKIEEKTEERLKKIEFRRNLMSIRMDYLNERLRCFEEGLPPPPYPTYGAFSIDYLMSDQTVPSQGPTPPGWVWSGSQVGSKDKALLPPPAANPPP